MKSKKQETPVKNRRLDRYVYIRHKKNRLFPGMFYVDWELEGQKNL